MGHGMTKDGKLSKRDKATLERAYEILSNWSRLYEGNALESEHEELLDREPFVSAMNAICGLQDFIMEV